MPDVANHPQMKPWQRYQSARVMLIPAATLLLVSAACAIAAASADTPPRPEATNVSNGPDAESQDEPGSDLAVQGHPGTGDSGTETARHPNEPASLDSRFDYFADSERHTSMTSTTSLTALVHQYLVGLRYDGIEAADAIGSARAEDRVVSVHADLSELIGIGGGIGVVRGPGDWQQPVGSFQFSTDYLGTSLAARLSRELVSETALSIRDHIMATDAGLEASSELFENRLSADLGFHHRNYSDSNSSNDLSFSPEYHFRAALAGLSIGYRFNYQSFARVADNGYWTPLRLVSNEAFARWKFDRQHYYGSMELSAGSQVCRGPSAPSSGAGGGSGLGGAALGALGIRAADHLMVELYGSGGDTAFATSNGWKYLVTGFRLTYTN
jgi:hypothetical protein